QRACYELLRSLSETKPVAAACYAGALFLIRYRMPSRFVSEDGWLFEFTRAWRKCCSKIAVGFYWDHRDQRMRQHYRELPMRCVRQMDLLLTATYARFGARLVSREQRKDNLPATIRKYLDDSFAAMIETFEKEPPWSNRKRGSHGRFAK